MTYKISYELVNIHFSDLFYIHSNSAAQSNAYTETIQTVLILDFIASHKELLMIRIHYLLILLLH